MTLRLHEEIYQSIKERALRKHRSVHAEILGALESDFLGANGRSFGMEDHVTQRTFRTEPPHFARRIL